MWFSEIAAEETTDPFLVISLTHGSSQVCPVRHREIQDHYSKWTLQRANRHQISGVTLFYFINERFTSEKSPTPKYFTWTAIHMCVENSAKSYSSSSYPFKECKVKKIFGNHFCDFIGDSFGFCFFTCLWSEMDNWGLFFSASSHQLPLCFGCYCEFGFRGKQAGNWDNPCSGETTLL